jgi:hypothetical protein
MSSVSNTLLFAPCSMLTHHLLAAAVSYCSLEYQVRVMLWPRFLHVEIDHVMELSQNSLSFCD